jgi:sialic acid synthase SpsE
LELIHAAKEAGADAVKFQTFTPETICANGADEYCRMTDGPWTDMRLRDLYAEAQTPREWHEPLFKQARMMGLQVWSTPFCPDDVDFLETLGCPRYKISSFDVVNAPLLERIAKTGKPAIMSTGMASDDEIWQAVDRFHYAYDLTLLHCISEYPANPETMNMPRLAELRATYACPVGLSDHSLTDGAAIMAVAMDAVMIEKHLTLDRSFGGLDAGFSLEPHEFKRMVKRIRESERAMYVRGVNTTNAHLRPSLWLVKDIGYLDEITAEHVQALRPGHGMPPCELSHVIGKRSTGTFAAHRPLTEGMVS